MLGTPYCQGNQAAPVADGTPIAAPLKHRGAIEC
jgi:hypothetical protein